MTVVSDEAAISDAVAQILSENEAQVKEFLAGKEKVLGFLVGQAMRRMKGKADPAILNRILREKLNERKQNS